MDRDLLDNQRHWPGNEPISLLDAFRLSFSRLGAGVTRGDDADTEPGRPRRKSQFRPPLAWAAGQWRTTEFDLPGS